MDTAVLPKTIRRRDVTREHILYGSATEEQQSRRVFFDETLRAELPLRVVAPPAPIAADRRRGRFVCTVKFPLRGSVRDFLTGC